MTVGHSEQPIQEPEPKRRQKSFKYEKENEADFAASIAEWLRREGHEVYCEVTFGLGGKRVDIVSKSPDGEWWAIECKMSAGMSVLEQADYWKSPCCFHRIFVAVPLANKYHHINEKSTFYKCCEGVGVGLIVNRLGRQREGESYQWGEWHDVPIMVKESPLHPHENKFGWPEKFLHPDQANSKPGTQGGHSTPFSRMVKAIVDHLKEHRQGADENDIAKILRTNYSSSGSGFNNLCEWIKYGKVKDIAVWRGGRRRVLILSEDYAKFESGEIVLEERHLSRQKIEPVQKTEPPVFDFDEDS